MNFEDLTKNQVEGIYNETVERNGREYLREAGYYDVLYDMEELDEVLYGESPSEILRNTSSEFNYYDNYFYFNGYGHLCSTNNSVEYYDTVIDMDDYVQWFISNYEDEVKEYIKEEEDERAN